MSTQPSKTPQEIVRELIMMWPSVRVPISPEEIQGFLQQFQIHLTEDFDTSVLALLLGHREDLTMSQPMITGEYAKILATIEHEMWLAVLRKINDEWKIQAFTFRCPRCFGQGYFYSGGEMCVECGGTGWGAAGDLEFQPGKLKNKGY